MQPEINTPGPGWSLDQWLAWQEQLHPKSIELGLQRVRSVAERMGLCPATRRTITVAGTNGKGSTARLIAEILRHSGYQVGLYTSPHLLRYNERVCINAQPVSDQDLCDSFAAIDAARGRTSLTYFEFGTLAALHCFLQQEVDIQVLEVGLGGRLDAVNILDADCAVLTSIGLDHQDWLGDSLKEIAAEKLGVARAGRPLVIGVMPDEAEVSEQADALNVQRWQLGDQFHVQAGAVDWDYRDDSFTSAWTDLPLPQAPGSQQIENAALALRAVTCLLGNAPKREAFERALAEPALAGRCQRRGRYWLDVSHNVQAAEALRSCLQARPMSNGERHLVLGMLADKDAAAYLSALAPAVTHLHCVGLHGPRGRSAEQLAAAVAPVWHGATQLHADVSAALSQLEKTAADADEIIVAGSFYTVAAALGVWA